VPVVIEDQPWPRVSGADLRWPGGSPVIDPSTGAAIPVLHDQIIFWVALAPARLPSAAGLPLIPVLLDTGFNDGLLIQQQQAEGWSGLALVARLGLMGKRHQVGPDVIPGRSADLWLYPNVPGAADPDPAGTPVKLELPNGAVITLPGSPLKKDKPLLGLLAVAHNGLTVRLDGLARRVSVDTP
jgi:hypothetical protein